MTGAEISTDTVSPVPVNLTERSYSVLLVGVGGQGVLTAAKILGLAATDAKVPVTVGQLHGMTQRGGSVECPVLFGPAMSSFITSRTANVVVAFEAIEALRALPLIGPETHVVINRGVIVPFELIRQAAPYPPVDDVVAEVRSHTKIVSELDGLEMVGQVGVARTLNVLMLGAISGLGLLPLGTDAVEAAVRRHSPPRFTEANVRAFQLGLGWAREQ